MRKWICMFMAAVMLAGFTVTATAEESARDSMINAIISTAKDTFDQANGKLQRAQYSGDIYICKNYTVYLFRQIRDGYRMAEFPEVPLVIPDNLPKDECKTCAYGVLWKEVPASEGNPFEVAAQVIFQKALRMEEE